MKSKIIISGLMWGVCLCSPLIPLFVTTSCSTTTKHIQINNKAMSCENVGYATKNTLTFDSKIETGESNYSYPIFSVQKGRIINYIGQERYSGENIPLSFKFDVKNDKKTCILTIRNDDIHVIKSGDKVEFTLHIKWVSGSSKESLKEVWSEDIDGLSISYGSRFLLQQSLLEFNSECIKDSYRPLFYIDLIYNGDCSELESKSPIIQWKITSKYKGVTFSESSLTFFSSKNIIRFNFYGNKTDSSTFINGDKISTILSVQFHDDWDNFDECIETNITYSTPIVNPSVNTPTVMFDGTACEASFLFYTPEGKTLPENTLYLLESYQISSAGGKIDCDCVSLRSSSHQIKCDCNIFNIGSDVTKETFVIRFIFVSPRGHWSQTVDCPLTLQREK